MRAPDGPPAEPPGVRDGLARLRQQDWALHAYGAVQAVDEGQRKEYRVAVNDLGATILRSGLAASIAALERAAGGRLVLAHLAAAGVAGLEGASRDDLPDRVRRLELDEYVIASREILQVAAWLRRAVQATFGPG